MHRDQNLLHCLEERVLVLAIITKLFILPDRLHLLEHGSQVLCRQGIDLGKLVCSLACRKLDCYLRPAALVAILLLFRGLLLLLLLGVEELELLLNDFLELARPEEVLQHGRGELAEQDAHEAEETLAHARHLIAHQAIVELELFV